MAFGARDSMAGAVVVGAVVVAAVVAGVAAALTEGGTSAPDRRAIAPMTPATGVGAVRAVGGEGGEGGEGGGGGDVVLACPGDRSGDRYREVRYDLPAPYRRLDTGVVVSGPGDPDATAAVQVFVRHREDRGDRVVEVGRSVVHSGQPGTLAVPLDDAGSVLLRVTCMVTTRTVTLTSPRLSR
jgi:hypothetical protein